MPNGQWKNSTRAKRLPSNWDSEIRPAAFALYGDICHVCHRHGANQIDHLEPGDDHSLENLRPIHAFPCHARKSSAEGGKAAQAKRPKRTRPQEPHPGLR